MDHADQLLEKSQWDLFWLPQDVRIVDRPELLFVSCDRGFNYLNMVFRSLGPAQLLPKNIEEVSQAHRHVTSNWKVSIANRSAALEKALAEGGYAPGDEHYGRVLDVHNHTPLISPSGFETTTVSTTKEMKDCFRVHKLAFGKVFDLSNSDIEQNLRHCTGPDVRVRRAIAYHKQSGEPASTGGITFFQKLRFGFFWGGGTSPKFRGQGAYRSVVAQRVELARRWGCTHVGLYARTDTSDPIMERLGFSRHGPMTMWERPPLTSFA